MSAPVAKRYARALFSLTSTDGNFESTTLEIAALVRAFGGEELASFATSATVDRATKRRVAKQLAERLHVSPPVESFLELLAENNRLHLLPAIEREYQKLADRSLGQVSARIRVAAALSAENLREIRELFERKVQKRVLAEMVVEPELLGGAVVEIQGRVYDGSVKNLLESMRVALCG